MSQLDVAVVCVQTNVLGEVGDLVLSEGKVGGVVDVDGVDTVFIALGLLVVKSVPVYVVLHLLDDLGVEEVVWENFVSWGEDDSVQVLTLENSLGEGVHELVLVDVNTSPGSGVQEGCVVLGTQEDLDEKSNLLAELADGIRVRGTHRLYMAGLDKADVVFDSRGVLVVLDVGLEFVAVTDFTEVLVGQFSSDVFQQVDHILLLLQEFLVSCNFKLKNLLECI